MTVDRVNTARKVAEAAAAGVLDRTPEPGAPPTRVVAMGDPQTRFASFASVLDAHGLLANDGWLRREVGLVCVGDYFDYYAAHTHGPDELEQAGREGLLILQWLAAHPPMQVTMLLGNHDAARVTELCDVDDESFAAARSLALEAFASLPDERRRLEASFAGRFPAIPTAELARRDFSTFQVAQRESIQHHLLAGRIQLAAVGRHRGLPLLLTHAGVTTRELDLLGLAHHASADEIALALNAWLAERVRRVRPIWIDGIAAPLDLGPLHVGGVSGQESGGLLSHRPANPERRQGARDTDRAWEFRPERPRRFHPHDLPPGLVQACGHTRAPSSARELSPWVTEEASVARSGELRSLRVRDRRIRYDSGVIAVEPGDSVLFLLDADLDRAHPEDVALLEVGPVERCIV